MSYIPGPFTPSTIPAAITNLVAAIEAAVNPGQVNVLDGVIRTGQLKDQVVLIGGWETTHREPATFGGSHSFSIEEQYNIVGQIICTSGSSAMETPRAAALALWGLVENAVMSDPTLGGAIRVCWFSRMDGTEGSPLNVEASGTTITFELACQARLN